MGRSKVESSSGSHHEVFGEGTSPKSLSPKNPRKAMVLAAGQGTRLRPLTEERAKPAIPLLGRALVLRLVERLAGEGIVSFRLNLHHLPDTVRSLFQSPQWSSGLNGDVSVSFSCEPEILGTAGGLKANESFFDDDIFIMANADIVMDFPIRDAIAFHRDRGALATLLLYPQEPPFRHHPIRMDGDGMLHSFKGGPPAPGPLRPETFVFTGVHILSRKVFDFIPPACFAEINGEAYPAAMERGELVQGFAVDGYWNDLGTPDRYLEAQRDIMELEGLNPAVWISERATIHETAAIGPYAAVDTECRIAEDAVLEDCVLWNGVVLDPGVTVKRSIIGSGVHVTRDCVDRVVTRAGEVPIGSD